MAVRAGQSSGAAFVRPETHFRQVTPPCGTGLRRNAPRWHRIASDQSVNYRNCSDQ
uniref:Uncharacterized protein n=1 Tax=Ectopseudomonas oleovorans TaxID=301 RepID=A0A653B5D7_ECTOL